jgi:2-hydroxyacyl-CoA lyase 1
VVRGAIFRFSEAFFLLGPPSMDGATILAKALRRQGVQYAFGVVGIPVIEVAQACQREGIQYIGMRNEQSASYAAGTAPPSCRLRRLRLTTSRVARRDRLPDGPSGPVHCRVGPRPDPRDRGPLERVVQLLADAGGRRLQRHVPGWGRRAGVRESRSDHAHGAVQDGAGAFQEAPQVDSVRNYCKYTARPSSLDRIPFFVEKAVRQTIYGRPGAAYIDMPGDMIGRKLPEEYARAESPAPLIRAIPLTRGAACAHVQRQD